LRTGWTLLAVVAAGAVAALAALVVHKDATASRTTERRATATRLATDLPSAPRPAFQPGPPRLLDHSVPRSRFAPVLRTTTAYSEPAADSAPVGRLDRATIDGTTNIALVTRAVRGRGGLWVHVRLDDNRSGWVSRNALGGYQFVHTHLVVDRARLVAVLYSDGKAVFRAPVGIGRAEAPTPAGEFYVVDRLDGFGNPFYGPVAFGTSARSPVLTDWPGGGVVGIHGTNEPDLIPGRISHGCIRMRNADILKLKRLLPIGTPLTVT
jgi:hypothetical protein